jgi:hypothetical protein
MFKAPVSLSGILHYQDPSESMNSVKNVVFWDVVSCRSYENRPRFGGTCRLHLQGRGNPRASVKSWLAD